MKKPNIVVVYTDQQRYDTLGCNGNPTIRTPNLDRLASEGTNFHQSHVACPICVPSRISFFTGKYSHGHLSNWNPLGMMRDERDFVTLLKEQGYHTALIGKNHCYPRGRDMLAFEYKRGASHTCFKPAKNLREYQINKSHSGGLSKIPYKTSTIPPEEDVSGRLCIEAAEYIEGYHHLADPFFLWLSIPEPHTPYMAPEPYASMYRDAEVPPPVGREGEMDNKPSRQRLASRNRMIDHLYPGEEILNLRRMYWGSVSYIDAYVGKVLDKIDELGIRDETIVVFTSDHGDYLGDHRLLYKGIGLYDCTTRVPLLIRAPGMPAGQSSQALVSNIDVMPTLLEIARVEPDHEHHGRSFRNVLEGASDTHRDALFLEYGHNGRPLIESEMTEEEKETIINGDKPRALEACHRGLAKGIRTERWKFVALAGDVDELYDLENDPDELTNLADNPKFDAIRADLRRRLLEELLLTQKTPSPERLAELGDRWWD